MNEDLNLDSGWRIGEDNFRQIVDEIYHVNPKVIVEFGAGASSIRLAQEFNKAKVVSIDHDIDYFRQAEQLRDSYKVINLNLVYWPLKWQIHGLAIYQSFQNKHLPEEEVDAVIIDGPPYYTFRGREACLYQIHSNLRNGGLVILDDYNREGEKEFVENWLARYPGAYRRKVGSVDDRVCILVKENNIEASVSKDLVVRNYIMLIRRIYDGKYIMPLRRLYAHIKQSNHWALTGFVR